MISRITKTYITITLLVFAWLNGFATQVTIMESQSFHLAQTMDIKWEARAQAMGYNTTIEEYSFLDDACNLEDTDILILASGLISLTDNQRDNVMKYVKYGGRLYIQSEYLFTHSGNIVFEYLVESMGGDFDWVGQGSGQQVPMLVLDPLKDNYNTVNQLSYFWFGTYGIGDSKVKPILQYQGNFFGHLFETDDPYMGKIITTSDQDWIRNNSNLLLMENILKFLEDQTPNYLLPEVNITSTDQESCAGEIVTFDAEVLNYHPGATLQWMINGQEVSGQTDTLFSSSDLQDGDVVECVVQLDQLCNMHLHVSNPILMAVVFPISNPSLQVSSIRSEYCEGEVASFLASASDLTGLGQVNFQWLINGVPQAGETSTLFNTSSLQNSDEVSCEISYTTICDGDVIIGSTSISVTIVDMVVPSAELTTDQTSACAGSPITFSVNGSFLGDAPEYQWLIDGVPFQATESQLVLSDLTDGQEISVIVTSNAECATVTEINTETITVDIQPIVVPAAEITTDQTIICNGEQASFTVVGENLGLSPTYEWTVDGIITGPNAPVLVTSNLLDGSVVGCQISVIGNCLSTNNLSPDAIQMQVNEIITPHIQIDANMDRACEGSSITFTATGEHWGNAPVLQWAVNGAPQNNNSTTIVVDQYMQGDIVSLVLISDELCTSIDTVIGESLPVEIAPIALALIENGSEHCGQRDGFIEVSATGGFAPIALDWNTGNQSNYLEELTAGNYELIVTDDLGCTAVLQTTVEEKAGPQIIDIVTTPALCEQATGNAEIFLLEEGNYIFHWMLPNGEINSTQETQITLPAGLFEVEVEDSYGCINAQGFEVEKHSPITVDLGEDFAIRLGESIELAALVNLPGELDYEWTSTSINQSCTGCNEITDQPTSTLVYQVVATTEFGCSATDEIKVKVLPNEEVFIPNVFSPNGDGANDFFTVFGGNNLSKVARLQIFDRWGAVLFEKIDIAPNAETEGWDGFAGGKLLDKGVYVYVVQLQFADGSHSVVSGDVSIF